MNELLPGVVVMFVLIVGGYIYGWQKRSVVQVSRIPTLVFTLVAASVMKGYYDFGWGLMLFLYTPTFFLLLLVGMGVGLGYTQSPRQQ